MMSQRPAILTTCRTCAAPIITGIDDYAMPVAADLFPLDRDDEIRAMAAGRDCWRLDHDRRLWLTDQWRILSDRPFPSDHRIAAHQCPSLTTEGRLF